MIAAAINRNRWLSRILAAASACSTRPLFAGGDGSSGSCACFAYALMTLSGLSPRYCA